MPPDTLTTPGPKLDRDNRLWTWDQGLSCYRHDEPDPDGGTILRTAEILRDAHGPLRDPQAPGNVFEWVLEHSRATGLAQKILRVLAFEDEGPEEDGTPEPATWPGYTHLWICTGDDVPTDYVFTQADCEPIADAVVELIVLGELSLDRLGMRRSGANLSRSCPEVTYGFPAYQQWLTEHEVTS
jgi:hypothetical protein